jgi:hypothetical protein
MGGFWTIFIINITKPTPSSNSKSGIGGRLGWGLGQVMETTQFRAITPPAHRQISKRGDLGKI